MGLTKKVDYSIAALPQYGLRKCRKCLEIQSEEAFSFRNKEKRLRVARCKRCVREESRIWYQNNRQRADASHKKSGIKWRARRRAEIKGEVERLKSVPCYDCHATFPPCVMQFDHRDPSQKHDNISTMVHNVKPLETILREVEKCDVVCANCHAVRTHLGRT